ncbi:glycosyltransferase family 2 protein [bacterium]|nr:glycosyltransferase family 2 protein [bacterium]
MSRNLLIIPAYNEGASIQGVIYAVRPFIDGDIVVIDDGSEDETADLARAAGAAVIRHPCNLGIGAAVQTGFLYGLNRGYDYVVRQDGDGQHDPKQIPRLLEVLQQGDADIVVGSRFLAREGYQSTWVRRVGIVVLGIVSRLVGTHVTDPTSGYWAVNRRALTVLARSHPDDYPETEALVLASRAGCRVREVPVIMYARIAGQSSIGSIYSGFYMLKVVLALLIGRLRPR